MQQQTFFENNILEKENQSSQEENTRSIGVYNFLWYMNLKWTCNRLIFLYFFVLKDFLNKIEKSGPYHRKSLRNVLATMRETNFPARSAGKRRTCCCKSGGSCQNVIITCFSQVKRVKP